MKKKLKRIGWALLAALTTPEAVKAEKNLAVIVLTRLALLGGLTAYVCERVIDALT